MLFVCQALIVAGAFVVVPMTTIAAQSSSDFGFSTNFPSFDLSFDNADWNDSTSFGSSSETKCSVSASASTVNFGESVTISWVVEGFDSITLNGVSVASDSDKKITFNNIQEETTYRLEATNANGDTCVQTVTVGCLVPVVHPICESFSIAESTVRPEGNMTFSWNTTNVTNVSFNNGIGSVPTVDGTNQTFQAPAAEGTYTYVLTFDGKTNHSCVDTIKVEKSVVTHPGEATVVAHKIVCTDEAQLPNWGAGGPNITANTAADWVAANSSCSLEAGWEFEWTADQSADPGDTLTGRAGAPWNAFGPTNASGRTQVTIDLTTVTPGKLWFREVLQTGFISFTHNANGQTNVDDVSAEFYCDTDVINYDNRDFVEELEKNKTYHCVAFNAPIVDTPVPVCDFFEVTPSTITLGETALLTWGTTNASEVFINNGIGLETADSVAPGYSITPSAPTVYDLIAIAADGQESEKCSAPITVLIPGTPAIDIDKRDAVDKDDTQAVVSGGTANFEIVVTNTGNEDLVNVVVTDPLESACNQTIGSLAIGASSTYTCSTTNIQSAFTNVANVTGDSAVDGETVNDTDPTNVTIDNPAVFTCADNVTFNASDTSIDRGDSSQLSWNVTGADSVAVSVINATGLTGTQNVSPSSDTQYVLTATKSGFSPIDCPITINVSTGGGGGGGGSSSPRCELEISDTKINRGDEITLTWDSSRARELILTDDRGNVIVTTEDKLSDDKDDLFEGEITLKPTRNTEYTLRVERGSRDRECTVDVEMDDEIVVLQTRDQAPLVAGISLTEVPYTGFEAGSVMTAMFYALLVAWALYITYVLVIPKTMLATAPVLVTPRSSVDPMTQAESIRPDVFSPMSAMTTAPTAVAPANLPVATPAVAPVAEEEVTADTETTIATEVENEAHLHHALLSSGAVQSLIAMTTDSDRSQTLSKVIADAKGAYPLEDGWVVINQTRLTELTATPAVPATATVTGNGSLAEAIVTGNVVAAYEMIGNRPMFALADAAADLDTLYRNRKGGSEEVSDLLTTATKDMKDEQIADMIAALTGALDGTYTDEASAVKMAIMKAVKIAA